MTVRELLAASLAAHRQAAELRHARKAAEAREALASARRLRLEAVAADPTFSDPAWASETFTHPKPHGAHPSHKTTVPVKHADLMRFYEEQLGQ